MKHTYEDKQSILLMNKVEKNRKEIEYKTIFQPIY